MSMISAFFDNKNFKSTKKYNKLNSKKYKYGEVILPKNHFCEECCNNPCLCNLNLHDKGCFICDNCCNISRCDVAHYCVHYTVEHRTD